MNTQEFLNEVAYVSEMDAGVYISKFDDSYITHVGMEDHVQYLAEREITEELTHGVGFSKKDNKWYGWSHRAISGFEIGSTCKKGDCHYRPVDKDDFLDDMVRFWDNEGCLNIKGKHDKQEVMTCEPVNPGDTAQKSVSTGEFEEGVYVEWTYSNDIPNKKLRKSISGVFSRYPESFGKGEWIAKTMQDAKQMAVDFSKGVS